MTACRHPDQRLVDPHFEPLWQVACEEGLPSVIHVADPPYTAKAFIERFQDRVLFGLDEFVLRKLYRESGL